MDFGPPSNRSIFIWGFLKDDVLACVETWDLSYRVIISGRIFWFLLEDFLNIIFLHGEIFEFP